MYVRPLMYEGPFVPMIWRPPPFGALLPSIVNDLPLKCDPDIPPPAAVAVFDVTLAAPEVETTEPVEPSAMNAARPPPCDALLLSALKFPRVAVIPPSMSSPPPLPVAVLLENVARFVFSDELEGPVAYTPPPLRAVLDFTVIWFRLR